MFGRNYINGSTEWLVVPKFPRNDGPPWTLNILDPYANWRYRGSSTSPKLGSGSFCILTVFLSTGIVPSVSFQFTILGSLRTPTELCVSPVKVSLWRTTRTSWKALPLVATTPAIVCLTDETTPWIIARIYLFVNNLCGEIPLVVSVSVFFLSLCH